MILWRPGSPGNVGSVARAMKNMGFTKLRIAEPKPFADPGYFATEAGKMAWDAGDVLDAREELPTIDAAVAGACTVAGTTSKPPPGYETLAPRDLASYLVGAAARGPVALLMGRESIGLTKEAIARCQVLGRIPASGMYGSLNLAQATLIFLYEIRLAAMAAEGETPPGAPTRPDEGAPSRGEIEAFYGRLTSTLDAIGFFEGSARAHMVRELRRIVDRCLVDRRDLSILDGIFHRVRLGAPRR